jgi:hypothetical protein
MIELGPATADAMVLEFLRAEIESPTDRRRHYVDWLIRMRLTREALIDHANLESVEDNRSRAQLLGDVRGYGVNRYLFTGFPADVQWRRVAVTHEELGEFRYVNHVAGLLAVSGPSRRVIDGATNVESGATGEFCDNVRGVLERVRNGGTFPDLIAVFTGSHILVEGNTRATAYVLAQPARAISVIMGSSPSQFSEWFFL